MKISKKAEYGLVAMVYLAKNQKNKKAVSLREIAEETKSPFEFLGKIFSELEQSGLVKAKRGPQGGYFLAKPANKITPGDIVLVLEEGIAKTHCSGCPMSNSCSSEEVWSEVQQSLDKSLNSTTLADLTKKSK